MLPEEHLSKILRALPTSAAPQVLRVAEVLDVPSHATTDDTIGNIVIGEEEMHIPGRVYFAVPGPHVSLPARETQVLSCILSRHHDGHVRARQVECLLESRESWAVPFVVQLLGEYVVEIAEAIAERLSDVYRPAYVAFWQENPGFIALTKARATSYWNCYYRRPGSASHYWSRETYPGLAALSTIGSWIGGDTR